MIRSFSLLAFFLIGLGYIEIFAQKNNPPLVKIIAPQHESKIEGSGLVQYKIKVSDREDGESEYGEIATNEIILEVRYVSDLANGNALKDESNGLAFIKKSNCFTCHGFNGKLIAPSFYDISKKYSLNTSNIAVLGKRITNGSGGVWGSASMPSHDEFNEQQAQDIAEWILENGQRQNLNFYFGNDGSFKVKPPENPSQAKAMVLKATYTDHGLNGDLKQSLTGKDAVLVVIK